MTAANEHIPPEGRFAFVVMQFVAEPWDFFGIVAKALETLGYFPVKADHVVAAHETREHDAHIWTLIRDADFVVVDLTYLNVNVYIELGVALANPTGRVGIICEEKAVQDLPFDVRRMTIHPYHVDLGDPELVAQSIRDAVTTAHDSEVRRGLVTMESAREIDLEPGTTDRRFTTDSGIVLGKLPQPIREELPDPAVALLATRYLQFFGLEDRLVASAGFPQLPPEWLGEGGAGLNPAGILEGKVPRLEFGNELLPSMLRLLTQLSEVLGEADGRVAEAGVAEPATDGSTAILGADDPVGRAGGLWPVTRVHLAPIQPDRRDLGPGRDAAAGLAAQREDHQQVGPERLGRPVPDAPQLVHVRRSLVEARDVGSFRSTARRLVFVRALLREARLRSSVEVEVLSSTLRGIAERARASGETKGPGALAAAFAAIGRFDRLQAISVAPTELQTTRYISGEKPPAPNETLTSMSTLGGALFLDFHIGILRDAGSSYADDAQELFRLTHDGKEPKATESVKPYRAGLKSLAGGGRSEGDDPREDFMMTLEHPFHFRVVLEIISEENPRYAAECILNGAAVETVWSRSTMWNNFAWYRDQLPPVINARVSPDRLWTYYQQHYIGFGRTPETSTFMRMKYRTHDNALTCQSWWPVVFASSPERVVRNVPNSVALTGAGISRQRWLGRLWRGREGQPGPADLRTAAGELLGWDGETDQEYFSSLLWDVEQWPLLGFPGLAIAELWCANWIVEALKRRMASPYADSRAAERAGCVLRIVERFTRDYLALPGDGVPGLLATLEKLQAVGTGSAYGAQLDLLTATVLDLSARLSEQIGA